MTTEDSAISDELMARFAECVRLDCRNQLEFYCAAVKHEATAELLREARADLDAAARMLGLARVVEYW